ncbi:MAG: hypothetical protein ACLSB7_07805 [Parabacteroides distasonis]
MDRYWDVYALRLQLTWLMSMRILAPDVAVALLGNRIACYHCLPSGHAHRRFRTYSRTYRRRYRERGAGQVIKLIRLQWRGVRPFQRGRGGGGLDQVLCPWA